MIHLNKLEDCCGCTSCAERCPKQCISMKPDNQGFLYPYINTAKCIECGLCERVCPILNTARPVNPIKVYAAYHNDEFIRKNSSSGGVFSAIAETIIQEGGVVFGARFDDQWRVVHSYTDSTDGLVAFRGSKYVQSYIGQSYSKVEAFLNQGRKVLFSGTPCQIAGLKHFLRKNYDNLYVVDFICHGVPSPLVWENYVHSLSSKRNLSSKERITSIAFRDKRAGWRKYGFSVWAQEAFKAGKNASSSRGQKRYLYEIQQQNVYLRGFLQNLYLRPSCFHCMFRGFKSGSDITLSDYWGVRYLFPNLDDDKGLSLIIQKTKPEFISYLNSLHVKSIDPEDYDKSFMGNQALFVDENPNCRSDTFWKSFIDSKSPVSSLIELCTTYSHKARIRDQIDIILLELGLYKTIKRFVSRLRK